MTRTLILGAVFGALATVAIAFAAPANASMANPGLGAAASGNVEQAQYYYGGHRRYRHWRQPYWRGYAYSPRRCWTQRVHTWNGWRLVRRCR
jgi:hypothetical protein